MNKKYLLRLLATQYKIADKKVMKAIDGSKYKIGYYEGQRKLLINLIELTKEMED